MIKHDEQKKVRNTLIVSARKISKELIGRGPSQIAVEFGKDSILIQYTGNFSVQEMNIASAGGDTAMQSILEARKAVVTNRRDFIEGELSKALGFSIYIHEFDYDESGSSSYLLRKVSEL